MICPLFSMMNKEESPCIKGACMWWAPGNDDLQTPAECLIASINRNILDTWLTIDKYRKGDTK